MDLIQVHVYKDTNGPPHHAPVNRKCIYLLLSFPPAATLTDVMTLDNPVNGSSPAIRTDYTGHKAKGETSPPKKDNFVSLLYFKLYEVK